MPEMGSFLLLSFPTPLTHEARSEDVWERLETFYELKSGESAS